MNDECIESEIQLWSNSLSEKSGYSHLDSSENGISHKVDTELNSQIALTRTPLHLISNLDAVILGSVARSSRVLPESYIKSHPESHVALYQSLIRESWTCSSSFPASGAPLMTSSHGACFASRVIHVRRPSYNPRFCHASILALHRAYQSALETCAFSPIQSLAFHSLWLQSTPSYLHVDIRNHVKNTSKSKMEVKLKTSRTRKADECRNPVPKYEESMVFSSGLDPRVAVHVALRTIRSFLINQRQMEYNRQQRNQAASSNNRSEQSRIRLIVLSCESDEEYKLYEELMKLYFPRTRNEQNEATVKLQIENKRIEAEYCEISPYGVPIRSSEDVVQDDSQNTNTNEISRYRTSWKQAHPNISRAELLYEVPDYVLAKK